MRSTVLLFPLLLLVNGGGSDQEPVALQPAEAWVGLIPPRSDTGLVAGPARHSSDTSDNGLRLMPSTRLNCPMPVVRPPIGLLIPVPVQRDSVLPRSGEPQIGSMPVAASGCVNPLFDSTRQ